MGPPVLASPPARFDAHFGPEPSPVRKLVSTPPDAGSSSFTSPRRLALHLVVLHADRLILMRDLLAPDGSIWVHLDDAEVHRMRCLLDEVFGAGNFVTSVAWQSGRLGQAA
jgi:hypothetical protein